MRWAPDAEEALRRLAELERRYLDARPEVREAASRRRVERRPIGELIKRANGFHCQLCEALGRDLIGFRKLDGEPYVEAYHVAPVAEPQVGALNSANVITVGADHIASSTAAACASRSRAKRKGSPCWSARSWCRASG